MILDWEPAPTLAGQGSSLLVAQAGQLRFSLLSAKAARCAPVVHKLSAVRMDGRANMWTREFADLAEAKACAEETAAMWIEHFGEGGQRWQA